MPSHTMKYVALYVALLVLTTTSLLSSFVTVGALSVAVAYAIALTKGSLVAWFFMHLSEESWGSRLTLVTAVLFVVVFAGLMIGDVDGRTVLSIRVPMTR